MKTPLQIALERRRDYITPMDIQRSRSSGCPPVLILCCVLLEEP